MYYGHYPGLFGIDVHGKVRVGQMVKTEDFIGTIVEIPHDDNPIVKMFCFDGLFRNFYNDEFQNIQKEFVRFV
jgi:hypothetical protein